MGEPNRNRAIESVARRVVPSGASSDFDGAPTEFYGKDVFNAFAIRKFLSRGAAEKLLATIRKEQN